MENSESKTQKNSIAGLKREIALIYFIQLALVTGFVQADRAFGLGGSLQALVGVLFIFLPVLVLDKQRGSYKRYGIAWSFSLKDIIWTIGAIAVFFPLVVLSVQLGFAVLGPSIWGLKTVKPWVFTLPIGYPGMAISHLIAVALPEEFFYRGYLMGRLDDVFTKRINVLGAKVGWSLLITSLAFGLGHFLVDLNPERLMVFFPALAFGWLKARSGNILTPILFHAASNIFMEFFRAGYGLR